MSNWFGDSMFPTSHLGLPQSGLVRVTELGLPCGSLVLSPQQADGQTINASGYCQDEFLLMHGREVRQPIDEVHTLWHMAKVRICRSLSYRAMYFMAELYIFPIGLFRLMWLHTS